MNNDNIMDNHYIPNTLKERAQWLLWSRESRNNRITKVPKKPDNTFAKTNDPSTWSHYETCCKAMASGKFSGLGFCFSAQDSFVGIDLDHCYSASGELEDWAAEIVDHFPLTFIEKSPSGDGIHIWCKGRPVVTGSKKWKTGQKEQGIEIYDYSSPRYFTVTGDAIQRCEPSSCQSGLEWIYQKFFTQPVEYKGKTDGAVVLEALNFIVADEYKTWLDVGMALKNGGFELKVWEDWSKTSAKYEAQICEEKWLGFKDGKITLGTLFHLAKQNGFKMPSKETTIKDWTNPDAYGEPVSFGQIETPELTSDCLPHWVKSYVDALSKANQTPPAIAIMFSLSVLATCLQKRYEVSPYSGYSEQLSLWTVTALPSASRKTSIVQALIKPVDEWQRQEAKRLAPEIAENETQIAIMNSRINSLTKKATCAEDNALELEEEIAELKQQIPEPLLAPKLYVSDATPEAVQMLLAEQHERTAIINDEGGIFEILGGLYSDGHATNLDVFLKGYSGTGYSAKRGNRQCYLSKIAVSLGLTVQPAVLAELSSGGKKTFRGKGLLGRMLFAVPRSNIGERNVRHRGEMPPGVEAAYKDGIKTLLDIPSQMDESGVEEARILRLSPEALDSWLDFSQEIENQQGEGKKFDNMQDWTGKLPGQALRIAGLCFVARYHQAFSTFSTFSPGSEIDKHQMDLAISLCKQLIPHSQAAFDLMETDSSIADAKVALKWISNNAKENENNVLFFKKTDLFKSGRFAKSKEDRVSKALAILTQRNFISEEVKLRTGKPTLIYYVNPYFMDKAN